MHALQTPTSSRRRDALGAHSLDHFALEIPDMEKARHFYTAFGLLVLERSDSLHLHTHTDGHCWGVLRHGPRKRLLYLSFGCYRDELARFRRRLRELGIEEAAGWPGAAEGGIWFHDCDGTLVEVRAAEKSSPDERSPMIEHVAPPGVRTVSLRSDAPLVRPRRLAHVLLFTRDVQRSIRFYSEALGLRLSDEAGGVVAFMHGVHGSDHHMLAFVQSPAPGFHHCSWDVSSAHEVGLGAMQMAGQGYTAGWGMGRHVLGSNYFHYVRDPWGSYSEYSSGMDFIPGDLDWRSTSHAAGEGFYLWGPEPPTDFAYNYEAEP